LWVRKSNFVSIRLSDIFFDFQPVWGQSELADELRHTVTRLVRGNPRHAESHLLIGRLATAANLTGRARQELEARVGTHASQVCHRPGQDASFEPRLALGQIASAKYDSAS